MSTTNSTKKVTRTVIESGGCCAGTPLEALPSCTMCLVLQLILTVLQVGSSGMGHGVQLHLLLAQQLCACTGRHHATMLMLPGSVSVRCAELGKNHGSNARQKPQRSLCLVLHSTHVHSVQEKYMRLQQSEAPRQFVALVHRPPITFLLTTSPR